MRYLKVDVKELQSSRLLRMALELKITAAEALGILVQFWAATRLRRIETAATPGALRECISVPSAQVDDTLRALLYAGYIEGEEMGELTIVDNKGFNALRDKRCAAGKLGAAARTKNKPKPKVKAAVLQEDVAQRSLVWDTYVDHYRERWHTTPVRNQRANALIKQLVQRLGAAAAADVARFYVAHNDGFYLQKTHDLQFLIRDCETLHTQMQRGQHITRNDVKQAERENHHLAQLHRVANGQL